MATTPPTNPTSSRTAPKASRTSPSTPIVNSPAQDALAPKTLAQSSTDPNASTAAPGSGENLGAVITDPAIRRLVYSIYVVLIIIFGATQAGFAAVQHTSPAWLAVTLGVLGYLGVPVGGLAVANTTQKITPKKKPAPVAGGKEASA